MNRLRIKLFTACTLNEDIAMQEGSCKVGILIESIKLLIAKSLVYALLSLVAIQEWRLEVVTFRRIFLLLIIRGLTVLHHS